MADQPRDRSGKWVAMPTQDTEQLNRELNSLNTILNTISRQFDDLVRSEKEMVGVFGKFNVEVEKTTKGLKKTTEETDRQAKSANQLISTYGKTGAIVQQTGETYSKFATGLNNVNSGYSTLLDFQYSFPKQALAVYGAQINQIGATMQLAQAQAMLNLAIQSGNANAIQSAQVWVNYTKAQQAAAAETTQYAQFQQQFAWLFGATSFGGNILSTAGLIYAGKAGASLLGKILGTAGGAGAAGSEAAWNAAWLSQFGGGMTLMGGLGIAGVAAATGLAAYQTAADIQQTTASPAFQGLSPIDQQRAIALAGSGPEGVTIGGMHITSPLYSPFTSSLPSQSSTPSQINAPVTVNVNVSSEVDSATVTKNIISQIQDALQKLWSGVGVFG